MSQPVPEFFDLPCSDQRMQECKKMQQEAGQRVLQTYSSYSTRNDPKNLG